MAASNIHTNPLSSPLSPGRVVLLRASICCNLRPLHSLTLLWSRSTRDQALCLTLDLLASRGFQLPPLLALDFNLLVLLSPSQRLQPPLLVVSLRTNMDFSRLTLILLLLLDVSLVLGAPCDGGPNTCDSTRCTESSKTSISSRSCSRCGTWESGWWPWYDSGCDLCHEYYTYVCRSKSGYKSNGDDCDAGTFNTDPGSNCGTCASGKYSTVSLALPRPRITCSPSHT